MSTDTEFVSVHGKLAPTRVTPETRASLDALALKMGELCRSAVDSLEIAAALEAEGLNDQQVEVRYGFADVFALAGYLYRRVARDPVEPPKEKPLWRADPVEHLLHGLLYALPAVCFPVAAPLLRGTATLVGFVIVTVVSWALSQGVAALAHGRLGRLDSGGGIRILRWGSLVALVVVWAVAGAVAEFTAADDAGLIFAGGQASYLLAATVLLVRGAQLWLLLCLLPGVLTSVYFLVLGQPGWFAPWVWGSLGVSLLVTVLSAAVATLRAPKTSSGRLTAREVRHIGPHALFGLVAAGLLTFPVLMSILGAGVAQIGPLLATPLSLSMAVAEWNLYRYRRGTRRLLHVTYAPAEFASGARNVLRDVMARYLVVAALFIAATIGLALLAGLIRPQWTLALEGVSYLALGGALFLALLLQALGDGIRTPLICLGALGFEAVVVIFSGVDPAVAQFVACAALIAVLHRHAGIVLGRAVLHA
jgi:hypothetical protein